MKAIFKIFPTFIVIAMLLCIVFAFCSCSLDAFIPQYTPTPDDGTQTPDDDETPDDDNKDDDKDDDKDDNKEDDKDDDKKGKYAIRFFLGQKYITEYYNEGDIITPPQTMEPYKTVPVNYVFDGWEGVEFKPVTGDAVYRANYKLEYNYYTATFICGGEKTEVKTVCGDAPKVPEFEMSENLHFVCWDKDVNTRFVEDVTITALSTKLYDGDLFNELLDYRLLYYSSKVTDGDNTGTTTGSALTITMLILEERANPQGGILVDRIIEHFESVVSPDKAPMFDACCYWSYAPLAGSIALAKDTPSVWNAIPSDIRLRLETMMKAFTYLTSYSTSDFNGYGTGPSMRGNYGKDWNPNYRLANVPIIVYATHYFGDGDMEKGAEKVNEMLKGFNEDTYTSFVNTFQRYGWRRALRCWTAEARTTTDGTNLKGSDAKTVLLYGGPAVGDDVSTASDLQVSLGNGAGVTNGGKDYLYKGYGLNEAEGIIRCLLVYNYGGETIKKGTESSGTFLEVKSDHWYDIDKDGNKDLVAWIVDGSQSPYHGQAGMMFEFASGNRSSTGYCSHDFILTTSMLYTCRELGIYDIYTDTYTDSNGVKIQDAVFVGNEDFLYKNEKGYQCYATGSYGESSSVHAEYNVKEDGTKTRAESGVYFSLKHLWRTHMYPIIVPQE